MQLPRGPLQRLDCARQAFENPLSLRLAGSRCSDVRYPVGQIQSEGNVMTPRLLVVLAALVSVAASLSASAALVIITDGDMHSGRVIARYKNITLRADNSKLYQFPQYLVHRVEVFPPTAPQRIAIDDGYLYNDPDFDSGVINSFERGMEFDVVEEQGPWTRVTGVRHDDSGWLRTDQLGEYVEFNPLSPDAVQPDRASFLEFYYRDIGYGTSGVELPAQPPRVHDGLHGSP